MEDGLLVMVTVDVLDEAVEPDDAVCVTTDSDTEGPADAVDEVISVV